MTHFSTELLEFEALRDLVGRFVSSAAGRRRLDGMQPIADPATLAELHAEGAEAIAFHQEGLQTQASGRATGVRLRFDHMPDIEPFVGKIQVQGSVLEGIEIRQILRVLEQASDARAVLSASGARFPLLAATVSAIADFRPLLRDLDGKIEPDGTLSDNASVALSRIRREMEKQQRQVEASLERFMRQHKDDGVLQEDFVAIRNDRFVLPVSAGQRRRVPGVMHASSGTGQTLFIEPLETVEMNNDLVRLRDDERAEIQRILAEMTDRLRAVADDVLAAVDVLAELDLRFSIARFAADFHCVVPQFTGRLHLTRARHPLLVDVLAKQKKRPVPLSLTLEGETRTLLISGPNTGGKTVAMKTIGLLALMAQAGLPVPADEAEFPLFDEVLADIGDQQSIEQSLSSFSAHILRVSDLLQWTGSASLVLLDEVGRATDPDEGGALAVAVIDEARRRGAWVLASTHLRAPKIYGASTEGVLNGAMSFDEQTLAPTYQLRTGAPGASAGIDIAWRLGLPGGVIDKARATLDDSQREMVRFLQVLEEKAGAATKREAELAEAVKALEAEKAAQAAIWEKRGNERIRQLEQKTAELIASFEKRASATIERIEASGGGEQRKFAEHSLRKVAQARREIREELETVVQPPAATHLPAAIPPTAALAEGVRVKLRNVREPARVRRILSSGSIEVEAGFLRMQVDRDDILEILPETPESAKPTRRGITVTTVPRDTPLSATRELNLLGKRAAEAEEELDRFLNEAALAGLERVRIVHGHGMGVLKKVVADVLSAHPSVVSHQPADRHEGGSGATVAELYSG